MQDTRRRRAASRFLTVTLVAASALALAQTPAVAADAAACGEWWPEGGTISGRHIPSNPEKTYGEFVLRTTFTFYSGRGRCTSLYWISVAGDRCPDIRRHERRPQEYGLQSSRCIYRH